MREIGIRIAIGAPRRHVLAIVAGHTMGYALLGYLSGVAAALIISRWIGAPLYQTPARDPVALGQTGIALLCAACLGVAARAVRAVRHGLFAIISRKSAC